MYDFLSNWKVFNTSWIPRVNVTLLPPLLLVSKMMLNYSIAHTLHKRANDLYSEISLDFCESPNISVEVNTDTLATMITEFRCISDTSLSNSTAVIPRSMLAMGAEMKVLGIAEDRK